MVIGLLPKMCGLELFALPNELAGFSACLINTAFPEDLEQVDYLDWMHLPDVPWSPTANIDDIPDNRDPIIAVIEHAQIPWGKIRSLRNGVSNGLNRVIMPWTFLTVWLSDADLPLGKDKKALLAEWLADGSGRVKLQSLFENFTTPCAGYWYTDDDPTCETVDVYCCFQ